jgi:hypothetical protein
MLVLKLTGRVSARGLAVAKPPGTALFGTIGASGRWPWSIRLSHQSTEVPRPPSTASTWPVMYEALSEAKNTIASATSAGSAQRPS